MIMHRFLHSCSFFTFNDERILAVVGGSGLGSNSNFSEFLSYDSENSFWDNRNTELDLPGPVHDLRGQLLVSNGETLFYINTVENVFFRLEWTNFVDGFQWIPMDVRLETPRVFAVGVLIPDELTDCNKTAINT